jgi:hypothetical protein
VVKSVSTGLIAVLTAVFVISHFQKAHAQTAAVSAEKVAAPARKRAEIDAVTWRAMAASWKKVRQIIDNGNPIAPQVPVYIISPFEEDPLSDEQKREIFARARKADLWRDIWFITVSSNLDGRYSAAVYFMPDMERGNFRQGKVLLRADNWIKVDTTPGRFPPLRGMLSDYVQVGAEPPECYQPTAQNMPFAMPPGFTVDEVAEIIQSIYPTNSSSRLDVSRSILGIYRRGDNVEVEMGVRQGGFFGRAATWKCKKTNGVWAVVDTGEWVN